MTHIQARNFNLIRHSLSKTPSVSYYMCFFNSAGCRLENCLLQFHHVLSPSECAQYCIRDKRCQSFNYGSHTGLMSADLCELNSCTKRTHREKLKSDQQFTHYDLIRQQVLNLKIFQQQPVAF